MHTTGMAIFLFLTWLWLRYDMDKPADVDLGWWLTRPLAIIGPLICTIPVLLLFRNLHRRGTAAAAARRAAEAEKAAGTQPAAVPAPREPAVEDTSAEEASAPRRP
ncbi:hypothetical protein ACFQY4_39465 [Catellatospora bangladeshensis]|uniref:hypothetical protein n=1 Tax=Catellatospora bangladeshensis TaxID=310355 RepID=UPI00361BC0C2